MAGRTERTETSRRAGRGFGAVLVAVGAAFLLVYAWSLLTSPAVNEGEAVAVPNPNQVYDPVVAGEPLPPGYRRVTSRDRIGPIYSPRFRTPAETDWPDDALVLGVSLDGESKAYPIRTLNRREMVLDRLGGTPILATW